MATTRQWKEYAAGYADGRFGRNEGRCSLRLRLIVAGLLAAGAFLLAASQSAQAGYAAYVFDRNSGLILHQENADRLNYPASLTKMMTLYLVFEAIDKRQASTKTRIPVSRYAAGRPPSRLGLEPGQTIAVGDAIQALATKSANDAATALAEYFSGSESAFAERMTERARRLGMTRTRFRNASGLPDRKQRTTARDMGLLARALFAHFPHHMHYFSKRTFEYEKRRYRNTNKLLGRYKGMDGIKTGYTRASGYNLVTSVRRGGHHVIAVVLGGKTAGLRDRRMRQLLDRAFANVGRVTKSLAAVKRPGRKPLLQLALAEVERPGRKPNPNLTMAARSDAGNAAGRLNAAAQAVGEALATYLAIPSARAHADVARGWAIQVGAYEQWHAAEQALDTAAFMVPALITETARHVSPVHDGRRTLYRARQVGLTASEAKRVCDTLQRHALSCLVAGPTS